MNSLKLIFCSLITVIIYSSCEKSQAATSEVEEEPPHIVFVTGDEEYRSEESMPMLGRILKRELGAKVSLAYAVGEDGLINPNRNDHIEGLEALETADLMVMFTRWRCLPDDQLKMIADYAESGRPMAGFRTATHPFKCEDPDKEYYNNQWPTEVFGQQWITHHGHFDDGSYPLTKVEIIEGKEIPVLRGVTPFDANSWLYHVDGGDWKLYGDSDPFLRGTSLKSGHQEAGRLDQFPLTNPVAWTKTHETESNGKARVFFTTLGHPFDFKNESMRKLALNGFYWALGIEDQIPTDGVNADIEGEYDPNNSGFGERFKKGLKPQFEL